MSLQSLQSASGEFRRSMKRRCNPSLSAEPELDCALSQFPSHNPLIRWVPILSAPAAESANRNSGRGRLSLLTVHNSKLLHPSALNALCHIDVALGVGRNGVTMRKFPYLMAPTAEMREYLPAGTVEDPDGLVPAVGDVHELLRPVGRKGYVPSATPPTLQRR